MMTNMPPPKTDWLAWILHALVGAVLVGICGAAVAYGKRRHAPILFSSFEAGVPFVIGTALVGAAFGSYLGERWWTGPSLFITPSEGFTQSRAGRAASTALGLLGVVLMFVAVWNDKR